MGWFQDGSTPVKEQAVKEEGQKNVNEQASEEHAHPLKNDQVCLCCYYMFTLLTPMSVVVFKRRGRLEGGCLYNSRRASH